MKKLIYFVMFSITLAAASFAFAGKNNFQFQVSEYATKRQGGQTLDVFVRYSMKDEVGYANYPDYRQLRKIALDYLEPTKDLPVDVYWEVIAAKIGDELMARYPLSGVSVQILTYPNEVATGNYFEPGFHGPIYTLGDVTPLSQVVMPTGSPRVNRSTQ